MGRGKAEGCSQQTVTTSINQGVRIEGVETPVSTLYASCYSDSSLPILLFVLLTLKSTALCDLKNIGPIMRQRVILRAITLRV